MLVECKDKTCLLVLMACCLRYKNHAILDQMSCAQTISGSMEDIANDFWRYQYSWKCMQFMVANVYLLLSVHDKLQSR